MAYIQKLNKIIVISLQKEADQLRKMNKGLEDDYNCHKEISKKNENKMLGDLESVRRELSRACKSAQDQEGAKKKLKEEVRYTCIVFSICVYIYGFKMFCLV